MAELEIRVLGRLRVTVDGSEIEEAQWSRKKARTLLKLLILSPRHECHREQLIDILWPEADAESGLNSLHKLVHAFRRTLEPQLRPGVASRFIFTLDQHIGLAPAPLVWVDLDEFDTLAAEGLRTGNADQLDAALALFGGDLLEEDPYADWVALRREQVRVVAQNVMDRLAQHVQRTDPARAMDLLRRLLALNRVNEVAHRRLMKLYAAQGQRHLALDQFRALTTALQEDLNVAPEAASVELYDQILAGAATAPAAKPAPVAVSIPEPPVVARPDPPAENASRRGLLTGVASAMGLALAAAGGLWYVNRGTPGAAAPARPKSLAILPLRFRESAEDMDFVAEGVTEGLINASSRLPGIRVMARATMFTFKGRTDALMVGRELKVSHVLSGRILREREGWLLSMELIDTVDGARLWGRQFSALPAELASLQQTAASELAAVLSGRTEEAEPAARQARSVQAANPEAHQLYLKSRFFANERTAEGLNKAIAFCQQAVQLDANYARAWAALADSYGLLAFDNAPARAMVSKARSAAETAIRLDETLAEAHTSLAMIHALYDWDWSAAERQFRRAIALNAGYATAHHWYGANLAGMGRFAEAQRELAVALDMDPLSPVIIVNSGYPDYYQRRYDGAISAYQKALELKPEFLLAHQDRMLALELTGRTDEAAQDALFCIRARGAGGGTEPEAGAALAKGGYAGLLRWWLTALEAYAAGSWVSPVRLASLAVRTGQKEKAVDWLRRAAQERSPALVYLGVDPQFDPIRQDARVRAIMQQAGLLIQR